MDNKLVSRHSTSFARRVAPTDAPPHRAAARHRSWLALLLLAAILGLAGTLMLACGAGTPAATPTPTAVPVLSPGQAAEVEGLKITVDNVRRVAKPNTEEDFIVYHIAAENVGNDNKTINPNDFYLVDGKGQRKVYDWSPPKEAGTRLKQTYLAAKEKVDGDLTFLVPRGDEKAVLTYQQPVPPQVYNPQLANWGLK